MLSDRGIDATENILLDLGNEINLQQESKSAFERADRYLQKTGDYSENTLKGEDRVRQGQKDKPANIEVSVTQQFKESAEAQLVGTFLTGTPIFASVASKENEDAALQITALSGRDERRFGWVGELQRCLDDALRYNICAGETLWAKRRAVHAQTNLESGSSRTADFRPIVYEGNQISRIDPYNLVWDRSVEPSKVHIDGNYVGYFKMLSYISLKRKFSEWNDIFIVKKNIKNVFERGSGKNHYVQPDIQKINKIKNNVWANFWGNSRHNLSKSTGEYEMFTLYTRIIPREYKLDVPNAGSPQVFKLIWVGKFLLYVEPIQAGHEYLPIVLGQLNPGDANTKSFVEYLFPLQDLATSAMTGTLESMRRSVLDRALYDPTRIRKADVESPSPISKIPVTGNSYDQDFRSAYFQIPFQDTVTPLFGNVLGTVFNLAEQETGVNNTIRGNFIPGNKTVNEFGTIISNAEARLQLGALRLENSFFAPIKQILKINYLVFASNDAIDNGQGDEAIQIDPVLLRERAPDFKMADGIMPSTKLASTDVLMQAVQMFSTNPQAFAEWDILAMMASALKQQGLTDIESYRRSQAEQQRFIQQQQAAQNPPQQQEAQVDGQQPQQPQQ